MNDVLETSLHVKLIRCHCWNVFNFHVIVDFLLFYLLLGLLLKHLEKGGFSFVFRLRRRRCLRDGKFATFFLLEDVGRAGDKWIRGVGSLIVAFGWVDDLVVG